MTPIRLDIKRRGLKRLFNLFETGPMKGYSSRMCLVPDRWNDMRLPQIYAYIDHIYCQIPLLFEKKEDKTVVRDAKGLVKAKIAMLYSLLGQPLKVSKELAPEQVHALISEHGLVDYVLKNYNLTRNPINVYAKSRFRIHLHGPDDSLSNLIAEEFAFADTFYLQYKVKDDIQSLEKMIGILYRPARDGKRAEFGKEQADQYQDEIAKWPYRVKIAILIWYEGCRAEHRKKYPFVYSPSNEGKAGDSGWLNIFLAMAGDKFGDFEKTLRTDAHAFLTEMNNRMKEAHDIKFKKK